MLLWHDRPVPTLAEDLAFRGLIHQMSDPELTSRLERPITLYAGFDPTADSLHIGNLLQLTTLRRLQLAGHTPIVLAGGATGMIGDPGGRDSERNLLSPRAARGEPRRHPSAARTVLGLLPDRRRRAEARLVNNAEWLGPVTMLEFLRDVGKHFTVTQMIQKESVRSRIERAEQGISYTEFSYMLLQAADYLHLHRTAGCDLQLGASDQWGNITAGIELVRRVDGDRVFALTSPLVLRPDGTKFGKSESGALFLAAETDEPVRDVPVLRPRRGLDRRDLPAVLHVPVPRRAPRARRAR